MSAILDETPDRPPERPESPCVGVCTLGDDDLCIGCLRSGDEIGAWTRMTPEQQWAVVQDLPNRKSEG
jgi:uncharacterized protein